MSKTVDDLHETFCLAVKAYMNSNGGALIWDAERAGIIAVVTALRDEMRDPSTFKSAKQECCGRGVPNHTNTAEECCCLPDTWLLHEELLGRINEILASSEGGSREAGGPTREGGRVAGSLGAGQHCATPAAPAPVCEWLDDGNPRKRRRNSCGLQGANQSWAGMNWVCTGCLRPIKFTEAQR